MMAVIAVNAQRTVIKPTDLPGSVAANIAKDYPGFVIKEAVKVDVSNVVTYDVTVTKGTTAESLVYDNAGKFLRKANQTAGTSQPNPAAAPTQKPATAPVTKK